MSSIEDLLGELTEVGTVDSEGEFSLDRDKAREKMRRFQLEDPRRYVLELVQAAAMKGASQIRFDIDARDTIAEFDGAPFTVEDFDDVYASLFSSRRDRDVQARRVLAIGVNAAMALSPNHIVVESGDGEAGARLELRPGEPDDYEAIETTQVGTRIHVRERFSTSTFGAFFRNLVGNLEEESYIRSRCRFAHVADLQVDLEGTRADGYEIDGLLDIIQLDAELDDGHRIRGYCALRDARHSAPRLYILTGGVLITTLEDDSFSPGFLAVVQDTRLNKDVSQSDILRDDAFDAMLKHVRDGWDEAIGRLALRYIEGDAPDWARDELLRALDAHGRSIGKYTVRAYADALRRVPFWRCTRGTPLTIDDLNDLRETRDEVCWTLEDYGGMRLEEDVPIVSFAENVDIELRLLKRQVGDAARHVGRELEEAWTAEQNRRAWRARPTRLRLPSGEWLARRTVSVAIDDGEGRVEGEVGLTAHKVENAHIALVMDGCVLEELEVDLRLLGLHAVVQAPFRPRPLYDGVVPDEVLGAALSAVVTTAIELYGDLAFVLGRRRLGPDERRWLEVCVTSFLQSVAELSGELSLLLEPLDIRPRHAQVPRLDLGLASSPLHPATRVPLFAALSGRRHSLTALAERAREGETVRYVLTRPEVPVESDVLLLDQVTLEILRYTLKPLGQDVLTSGDQEVARLVARARFLERTPIPLELDPGWNGRSERIEGDGFRGVIGLAPSPEPPRGQTVVVARERRPVGVLPVFFPGTVSGIVTVDELALDDGWHDVEPFEFGPGGRLSPVRAAVGRTLGELALEIAAASSEVLTTHLGNPSGEPQTTKDLRVFLQELVAFLFPRASLRRLHDGWCEDESSSAADDKTSRLLGAYWLRDPGQLDEALNAAQWTSHSKHDDALAELEQHFDTVSRPPRSALAAIDVLFPADEDASLTERALRPAPPLDDAPLWRWNDGKPASCAAIRAQLADGRTLQHVLGVVADVELRIPAIARRSREELSILQRIVGTNKLLSAEFKVERARNKKRFESAERRAHIAVPENAALVRIALDEIDDLAETEAVGEVGLRRSEPDDDFGSRTLELLLHKDRRFLETVAVKLDTPAPSLVAAVDDAELNLSFDYSKVLQDRVFKRIVEACTQAWEPLIAALVSAIPALRDADELFVAWRHALDYMYAKLESCPPDRWKSVLNEDPALLACLDITGFRTLQRRGRSLRELHALHDANDGLFWLADGEAHDIPASETIDTPVLLLSDTEATFLDAVGLERTSFAPKLETLRARASRRASAPRLEVPRADENLAYEPLTTATARGAICIPRQQPDDWTVALGIEGRVLERVSASSVYRAVGAVEGDGILASEDWSNVTLSPVASARLRDASRDLYFELVRWYRRTSRIQRSRYGFVLDAMAHAVVQLRRISTGRHEGRDPASLDAVDRALLEGLSELPLLQVTDRHRITLATALREHPPSLGHLDLWDARTNELESALSALDELGARYEREDSDAAEPPRPHSDASSTTPAVEPVIRSPGPEDHLVEAIRDELRLVREHNESLLADVHLDAIRVEVNGDSDGPVAAFDERGVFVNAAHPLAQLAMGHEHDTTWRSLLVSSVFTALNVWLHDVMDHHEGDFLAFHLRYVGGAPLAQGRMYTGEITSDS